MKHGKPANFATLVDDIGDAFATVAGGIGRAARHIGTLPWPALLLAALMLALVLTVVPLALVLFVAFMLVKFAVAAFAADKPRGLGE